MKPLHVLWKNYAVGQGGMALMRCELDDTRVNVLYDCGAESAHGSTLLEKIDLLAHDLQGENIDLLVISHLHADHLSGLGEIRQRLKNTSIETIMLPMWDVATIAIAAVPILGNDPSLGDEAQKRLDILRDPQSAINSVFPEARIIFVERAVPDEPEGDDDDSPWSENERRDSWEGPIKYEPPAVERGKSAHAKDCSSWGTVQGQKLVEFKPYCVYSDLEKELRPEIEQYLGVGDSDSQAVKNEKLLDVLASKGGAKTLAKLLNQSIPKRKLKTKLGKRLLALDMNRSSLAMMCSIIPTSQELDCEGTIELGNANRTLRRGRVRSYRNRMELWWHGRRNQCDVIIEVRKNKYRKASRKPMCISSLWMGDGELKVRKVRTPITSIKGK